jgi:hypothetical protein
MWLIRKRTRICIKRVRDEENKKDGEEEDDE